MIHGKLWQISNATLTSPPVTWELGFSGDSTDTIWETAEGAAEDDKAGNLSHHQC